MWELTPQGRSVDHGRRKGATGGWTGQGRRAHDHDSDLATLAAAYGFGLSSNHPFIDGNKRVALMAIRTFLAINGYELEATETEAVRLTFTGTLHTYGSSASKSMPRCSRRRFSRSIWIDSSSSTPVRSRSRRFEMVRTC